MANLKKAMLILLPFSLLAVACESDQAKVSVKMNKMNARSYRDMRQHTFNENEKLHYNTVAVSPDAATIALVSDENDNSDIFIKGVNSKSVIQKTDNPAADEFPAFSPDGTKLAFASNRNGNWDIYILNVSGGKATRQITFGKENCEAPSWSHDGKKLAYNKFSNSTHMWEIWIYNFETGSYSSLTTGRNPVYSPVNDTIVFQRGNTKSWYALWVIDDEGKEEMNILSSNEEGYFHPSWSYDGAKIVFASGGKQVIAGKVEITAESEGNNKKDTFDIKERRGSNIWVINRDGSDLTRLTDDDKAHYWGPRFSSDGRIYFIAEQKVGKDNNVTNVFSVFPEFVNTERPVETAKRPAPIAEKRAVAAAEKPGEKPPVAVSEKPPVVVETPIAAEEEAPPLEPAR